LAEGIRAALAEAKIPAVVNAAGSLLTLFFCPGPVGNYADARRADTQRFAAFFHAMLERGVFLPPSQFEAWFVSAAHGDTEIQATLAACRESVRAV
jgi:glutamate-1-semialdehyde 2,1-aminomutase